MLGPKNKQCNTIITMYATVVTTIGTAAAISDGLLTIVIAKLDNHIRIIVKYTKADFENLPFNRVVNEFTINLENPFAINGTKPVIEMNTNKYVNSFTESSENVAIEPTDLNISSCIYNNTNIGLAAN